MSDVTLAITLALASAALLSWLLRPWRRKPETRKSFVGLRIEELYPRHYRYFPQVRQALSAVDEEYLRKVAGPQIARQALTERREVARKFLAGLREDFLNLERLARTVAALSPVVSREQETERFLLNLRFHALYTLVQMRLSIGRVPVQRIEYLTGLVGNYAMRMERAMAAVSLPSANQAAPGFNA
jgi:hypothetical protein